MTIRIADLPDLGAVTDDCSVVGEHAGAGRFAVTALRSYIGAATGDFATSTQLATQTAALAAEIAARKRAFVSGTDSGAVGDGAADDTAAINAALAAHAAVDLPAGIFKTTSSILMTRQGQKLRGVGHDATVIEIHSTTADGIVTSASIQSLEISGLTVRRVGTPVGGASGINASAICGGSAIYDVWATGNWVGFELGVTDYSTIERCVAQQNLSHGFFLCNSAAVGPLQWYPTNCLSQKNGGCGFAVAAAAGTPSISMGTMTNCATFANTGLGVSILDLPGAVIQGVRIIGGFFGEDGGDEIAIDTHGIENCIRDVFIELAGMGSTGPTLATPASHVGNGISTSATVSDITITGCHINQCSRNGMYLLSGVNHLVGNRITNCGQAGTTGARNGIGLGTGQLIATGNQIGNTTGYLSQVCGIDSSGDGSALTLVGNDFTGNNPAAFIIATNNQLAHVSGNTPNGVNTVIPSGGLVVGVPTGGGEGDGTINVSGGYYVNGVAIATGAAGVTTVAGRSGAVTLTHSDLTDWAAATSTFGAGGGVSSFNTRTGAISLTNLDVANTVATTPLFCGPGSGISGAGNQSVLMNANGMIANMSNAGPLATFMWSASASAYFWMYNSGPLAQLGTSGVLALVTGISGQITGVNPPAGIVGEYLSTNVPLGSPVTLTNGATANIASISLTAGDWDVSGVVGLATASVGVFNMQAAVSRVSATLPADTGLGGTSAVVGSQLLTGTRLATGTVRVNQSSTATVYLVLNATFPSGTASAFGFIGARRMR